MKALIDGSPKQGRQGRRAGHHSTPASASRIATNWCTNWQTLVADPRIVASRIRIGPQWVAVGSDEVGRRRRIERSAEVGERNGGGWSSWERWRGARLPAQAAAAAAAAAAAGVQFGFPCCAGLVVLER